MLRDIINLRRYYLPGELEREIEHFVEYYNNQRYHESLENLTPDDVYNGRRRQCLLIRDMIKQKTLKARKAFNLGKGERKNQLYLLRCLLIMNTNQHILTTSSSQPFEFSHN